MRMVILAALAATASVASVPASAAVTPTATATACSASQMTGANDCRGGYIGNLNQGTLDAPGLAALQAMGYTGGGTYAEKLDIRSGDTIDFLSALTGIFYVGVHYGAAGDPGGTATSFYRIDGGATGFSTLTFNRAGLANNSGLSNATLFLGAAAVPEPATWAMMLLGFGAVGFAMRRRRSEARLLQIA